MDQVYLKNFAIWLGAPLLMSILLPWVGIYIPLFGALALAGGTVVAIIMTHKEINHNISFNKAILPILIMVGGVAVITFILHFVRGYYFMWLIEDFVVQLFSEMFIAVNILLGAGVWYMFEKAGKPGWACIIPIYNWIIMLEIAKKPTWYLGMFFIPVANIIFVIYMLSGISKNFGKEDGFTVGLVFLGQIFMAILGFSDAQYVDGPTTQSNRKESVDLLDN